MFFAWILLSYLTFKILPWWGIFVVFLLVGFTRPAGWKKDVLLAVVSGLVFVAIAFLADGRHSGLISRRMAGLLALPTQDLIFLVMFAMSFASSLLTLQAGAALARLFGRTTV